MGPARTWRSFAGLALLLVLLQQQEAGTGADGGLGIEGLTAVDTDLWSAEELQHCLNDGEEFKLTSWNSSIFDDTPANLHLEQVLWSRKPRTLPLTIITQLSIDRIPALFNQCSTYQGPISAAIFIPLIQLPVASEGEEPQSLSTANMNIVKQDVARVKSVWEQIERAPDMCQLDVMLFWEAFDSAEASNLYPVNALRNYARMQVRTPLVSAIDVDMMISKTLGEELATRRGVERVLEHLKARQVVVLPAFEPSRGGPPGRTIADSAVRMGKDELMTAWKQGLCLQFKLKVFSRGHTPTNYTAWFQATEGYPVAYKRMYEPWFITRFEYLPMFDVRFRGYGLNKIVHVASLNAFNFTFAVHSSAWIVHRPHDDTPVRDIVANEALDVNQRKKKLPKNSLFNKVTLLFGQCKREMLRGVFQPRTDERMERCYAQLPWLQRPPQLHSFPVDPKIFI